MIDRNAREAFVIEAITKQLEIAGLDPALLKASPSTWIKDHHITEDQRSEWRDWFISELRNRFKMSKKAAESEFSFFDLQYGLSQSLK